MFTLDEKLNDDTIVLGQFDLCQVLLMNDQRFTWFILVPARQGVTEIFQLADDEQQLLMQEASYLSETLADAFEADSMNVATLGNVVAQLHVHVVVRKETDACWPDPVWGRGQAVPYQKDELSDLVSKVRLLLSGKLQATNDQSSSQKYY